MATNPITEGPPYGAAPAAGCWRAVLSLGSACAIAYHLHRRHLATRTGPLDWFGSRDPEYVARLLATRFSGFMNRSKLSVMGVHEGYWKVGEPENEVYSLHDFPVVGRKPRSLHPPSLGERLRRWGDRLVEPVWRWLPGLRFPGPDGSRIPLPAYPEFRRRVDRRVKRFLAAADDPGPVLFIRRARLEGEAEAILAGLEALRGDRPTTLLVLGSDHSDTEDPGVPGLRTAVLPPEDPSSDESWRGRDEDWDRLLEGCRVEPR